MTYTNIVIFKANGFEDHLGALLDGFLLGLGGDALWFLSIAVAFRSESTGFEYGSSLWNNESRDALLLCLL